MDRFFSNNIDLQSNKIIIDGDDVKHITKVLRMKEDNLLEICDNNDNEYIAKITTMSKKEICLDIVEHKKVKRESKININLFQGYPKGAKFELIIQKLTEIGVCNITPIITARVINKSLREKEAKKFDRWEKIIYEASKQSKRGVIPKLNGFLSLKEMIDKTEEDDLKIVFYENEDDLNLKDIVKKINKENIKSISIVIGPEGGFEEDEIGLLKENNYHISTLGKRILRTETASIVAASLILYEFDI
ncbi:RsmE family RNA methyltransferase [Peptostreptococcaceae bacterium AGR-M142]